MQYRRCRRSAGFVAHDNTGELLRLCLVRRDHSDERIQLRGKQSGGRRVKQHLCAHLTRQPCGGNNRLKRYFKLEEHPTGASNHVPRLLHVRGRQPRVSSGRNDNAVFSVTTDDNLCNPRGQALNHLAEPGIQTPVIKLLQRTLAKRIVTNAGNKSDIGTRARCGNGLIGALASRCGGKRAAEHCLAGGWHTRRLYH